MVFSKSFPLKKYLLFFKPPIIKMLKVVLFKNKITE